MRLIFSIFFIPRLTKQKEKTFFMNEPKIVTTIRKKLNCLQIMVYCEILRTKILSTKNLRNHGRRNQQITDSIMELSHKEIREKLADAGLVPRDSKAPLNLLRAIALGTYLEAS